MRHVPHGLMDVNTWSPGMALLEEVTEPLWGKAWGWWALRVYSLTTLPVLNLHFLCVDRNLIRQLLASISAPGLPTHYGLSFWNHSRNNLSLPWALTGHGTLSQQPKITKQQQNQKQPQRSYVLLLKKQIMQTVR